VGVAGVVLAAGASRRMGRNKMLLALDGEPLVRRAARHALAAGLSPVVVVLGHEAAQVREALADLDVVFAENPDFQGPTSTSLQKGIERVPREARGAVVLLGDMVKVTDHMLTALAITARRTAAPLVASRYGDVVAPPFYFDRRLFSELAAWTGEGAGPGLVARHPGDVVYVDWPEDCLADVDTPEDLERLSG
jgi:molybdenum cofactor cytidylyltransferase